MQPLLTELAEIRAGLTLRGKDASRHTVEEGLHLLRISDLTEDGHIEIKAPHLIDPATAEKFTLHKGDIVVANRGSRMTAALSPSHREMIAGGQFFIIRINPDTSVIPEYLHWFLNLGRTQTHLFAQTRGSYVKTMPISVLKKLPIPIPPMESQHIIRNISKLAVRERELVSRISELRQIHLETSLSRTITD